MAGRGMTHGFAEDGQASEGLAIDGDDDIVFPYTGLRSALTGEFGDRAAVHIRGHHGPLDGRDMQIIGEGIEQRVGLVNASGHEQDREAGIGKDWLFVRRHAFAVRLVESG